MWSVMIKHLRFIFLFQKKTKFYPLHSYDTLKLLAYLLTYTFKSYCNTLVVVQKWNSAIYVWVYYKVTLSPFHISCFSVLPQFLYLNVSFIKFDYIFYYYKRLAIGPQRLVLCIPVRRKGMTWVLGSVYHHLPMVFF